MWNPSIRKYAIIPTKELEQELEQEIGESQELVFGLFYSSCTDDYRIILIFYEFYNASAPLFVKIFSLNSRTWSAYTKPVPRYHLACSWSQVNVNNALHWFAKDKSGPNMIIAFKLHDEVFCGIPLPPDVVNHRIIEPIQLNDCLAIYTNDLKEEIQLWVMPNYGNTESWTFLLKLKIEDFILGITFRLTKEHCVEFFHFSEKKEELLCYNCEKKDTRTLDISCCDAPQMGFFTESMGLYSESRYVVMSNEETHRSGRFIAELVKICMKSLDKMLSAEEHSVAVLPDPASKTLTIRDNGMGITERELLNSLDIWEDFGSSEKDTMMVILFGDLKHLLHKVIVSTTEDQYVMLAQPGGTLSLRKDTGGEVLARGTKVVVHLDDDLAEYCLDERVLTTLLNKYLDCTRYAFRVGSSVDE